MKFGIQSSRLRPAILVGQINRAEAVFLAKEEATDLVLGVVGEYVRDNFNGAMKATFPGLGFDLTVTVTPRREHEGAEGETDD